MGVALYNNGYQMIELFILLQAVDTSFDNRFVFNIFYLDPKVGSGACVYFT